jgi:hypothetical protein
LCDLVLDVRYELSFDLRMNKDKRVLICNEMRLFLVIRPDAEVRRDEVRVLMELVSHQSVLLKASHVVLIWVRSLEHCFAVE